MKNLSSVVASIVLILIAIHELRYLRKVVIKEKKSKSEIFVTIIAFIVISIITYFYAKCFWDYLMFATGLLCLVADVWKQGLSEDGVLIVARGKELYKWTETVKAMCTWAKKQPHVTHIIAETEIDNLPSQRILTRCGFVSTKRDETIWWKL